MTHTPGPWSAAYFAHALRHIERNVDRDAYLPEEDAKEIDAGRLNVPNCRYNHADVALIAAAPDLLEALEALTSEQNGPPLIRHETAWRAAMDQSFAAIAKARGSS